MFWHFKVSVINRLKFTDQLFKMAVALCIQFFGLFHQTV